MYAIRYFGHIMIEYIDKIISIYAENSKNNKYERPMLLRKFSIATEILLKSGVVLYFLAGCFYILNPIYIYYAKNEIVPLLPLYMPFIDETTKSGFILLTAIHLGFLFIAVVASACTDLWFALIAVNIFVPANIFCDNVRELSEILSEEKVNTRLAKAKLLNVLLIHREICE